MGQRQIGILAAGFLGLGVPGLLIYMMTGNSVIADDALLAWIGGTFLISFLAAVLSRKNRLGRISLDGKPRVKYILPRLFIMQRRHKRWGDVQSLRPAPNSRIPSGKSGKKRLVCRRTFFHRSQGGPCPLFLERSTE